MDLYENENRVGLEGKSNSSTLENKGTKRDTSSKDEKEEDREAKKAKLEPKKKEVPQEKANPNQETKIEVKDIVNQDERKKETN